MNIFSQVHSRLPKCEHLSGRDRLFDSLCLECSKARMWKGIADAAVQIAPYFVEAIVATMLLRATFTTCRAAPPTQSRTTRTRH